MGDYDEEFLMCFNDCYPFERYIFKEPKSIGMTFDDMLLTELFVPHTEIEPVLDENNKLLYFTSIPYNEVYVKVVGNAGEMRIGYLDFEEHIRTMIRCNFIEDFGGYEYEGLYVDHDDEGDDNASLIAVLKNQKALIEEKYGECNIKPSVRSNLVNE